MSTLNLAPRWVKLLHDLLAEKDRIALMLAAITVSLVAVGAVLGGYAVLSREVATNYLGTHPAEATLELPQGVDDAALAVARHRPEVQAAEARDVVLARANVRGDWRPLLLFVVDDFDVVRLNTFRRLSGPWPPPEGSMLVERTASGMLATEVGGKVWVKTAHGAAREVLVAGLVHDAGLAPAWQERSGYGYITRSTLAALGEAPELHELRIGLRDPHLDLQAIEQIAQSVARELSGRGHVVHEIRVPPPRQHPHQKQMMTILFLLLAFSVMALVLSGVLAANALSAMLARQVREIGVMKAIGASGGQIARLYAVAVLALGAAAVVIAVPAGFWGSQILARAVAGLLNLEITAGAVPAWVFGVQALAGVLVPLAIAAIPIGRASRLSVREAIDRHGVSTEALRARTAWLPWPARNALRRPARLALTVGLLATGGAMFMTALNVAESWERMIARVYETRHYDVELRFYEPQPLAAAQRVRQLPGVVQTEPWGFGPTAFTLPGRIDVVRTYPDRGHASFSMMAPPASTRLISFPQRAGRWLRPGDTDAVVLNHAAAAQVPGIRVGDGIDLSIDAAAERRTATWRVVGIVEEIGAAGVAYVADEAFARLAGTQGRARLLRVATSAQSDAERTEIIRAIEQRLADDGVGVEVAWPLAELRTAMGDHVVILIRALLAMAGVMAVVGGLGLSSAMSVSVLERMRELAVMKTIGATPARIVALLVAEALFIGALSWVLALAFGAPLTGLVDALVGNLGFVAPLPFVVTPASALAWLALTGAVAFIATWIPARRAGRLTVARALVWT